MSPIRSYPQPKRALGLTNYGFEWGQVTVERIASVAIPKRGVYRALLVETPRERVEVTVTPCGLIRLGQIIKKTAVKGKQ